MFPFWIARRNDPSSVVAAPHHPQHVAAFTSLAVARMHMQKAGEKGWQFKVVGRAALRRMLPELRRTGFVGVCFDPGEEGGGKTMSFAELEQIQ
jgi:hypothetical protein